MFFVGDSITFGWRDEDMGGWPNRLIAALSNRHAVTAYNLGVRGDTSRSIRARWNDEVARRRQSPHSVIIFAFGANAAKLFPNGELFVPLDETRENTAEILRAAGRENLILLIGPAPVEESVMRRTLNPDGTAALPTNRQIAVISSILEEESARAGVPYLNLLQRLVDNREWFADLSETDGIHPPARGHDAIAAVVRAWPEWTKLFQPSATA
jgi:acyl-CoA thioesterase I